MITKIEQLLIGYLETSKAREPEKTLTFLALDTEDQMLKMCHYLSENENATGAEILAKAQIIATEK